MTKTAKKDTGAAASGRRFRVVVGSDAHSSIGNTLRLLEIIGPQVALALERAEWQERATEFELRSITDPLTALPNFGYLEKRLPVASCNPTTTTR